MAEAAGVVLAVLPLLVKSLSLYLDGTHQVKELWRWKSNLKEMIRKLKMEQVIFQNTCMNTSAIDSPQASRSAHIVSSVQPSTFIRLSNSSIVKASQSAFMQVF